MWHALTGEQRSFAVLTRSAARYRPGVAPFGALRPGAVDAGGHEMEEAWAGMEAIVGPGRSVGVTGDRLPVPAGWDVVREGQAFQMVGTGVLAAPDPEAEVLGPADADEIMALIERTRPGPFLPETVTLGGYVGHRVGGRLVAMAGERMRPPGYTEISSVATLPTARGRGLATRLVLAVSAAVVARGELPFLHVAADNLEAVRLYRRLGFEVRRQVVFQHLAWLGHPEGAARESGAAR